MRRRRLVRLAFGACTVALVAALAWLSNEMLDLERAETKARAEARYQENLRIALWRLDNRVVQLLAREAERPPDVYMPFYALKEQTYTRNLAKIEKDEVLAQSPLLGFKPDYVRLHFQVDPQGVFTSPQAPEGVFRELADGVVLASEELEENEGALGRVRELVDPRQLDDALRRAEEQSLRLAEPEAQRADASAQKRWQIAAEAKSAGPRQGTAGPLEPLWRGDELLFLRRARIDGERYFQGFLADWPRLEALLLEEIEDLFPEAALSPAGAETGPRRLFTLPVLLDAPAPPVLRASWTATHSVLAIALPVILAAIAFAGIALRKSQEFGERQRRFASLVTHELRSPLTTFRLYSDLLAEGLVRDEGKRDLYQRTLQKESDHMARMVENVIAHARVEEGRAKLQRQRTLLGPLLDQLVPDLKACAARGGLPLEVEADGVGDTPLETDPAAVGQILGNLVENACRYGRSERGVRLTAAVHDRCVRLVVRDFGPGVSERAAGRIFRPFERGDRDESDPVRGLGLGLALSRGLARDLGGDLALERPRDGGARFVLTLPVSP